MPTDQLTFRGMPVVCDETMASDELHIVPLTVDEDGEVRPIDQAPSQWWRNNVARLPLAIKPGEVRRFSDGAILRRLDDGSGSPRYLGMTMTSRLPEPIAASTMERRNRVRMRIADCKDRVRTYFDRLNEAARRA